MFVPVQEDYWPDLMTAQIIMQPWGLVRDPPAI